MLSDSEKRMYDIIKVRNDIKKDYLAAERYVEKKEYQFAANTIRHFLERIVKTFVCEHIPEMLESEDGKRQNLYSMIVALYDEEIIDADTKSIFHELRLVGNAGSHTEDNYEKLEELRKSPEYCLSLMVEVIALFDEEFETKEHFVRQAVFDFIEQFVFCKYELEFAENEQDENGQLEFTIWFDEYIDEESPAAGRMTYWFDPSTSAVKVQSVDIRYDGYLCLGFDGKEARGLWVENSTRKGNLFQFLKQFEKVKGMEEEYYINKYSKNQETASLWLNFDLLAQRGGRFLFWGNQEWYISKTGEISELTSDQRIERALDKKDRDTLTLFIKRVVGHLRGRSYLNCNNIHVIEKNVLGVGNLLIGFCRDFADIRIGYRYDSEEEQYFYLLSEKDELWGTYKVDSSAPHAIDMDEENNLPGRAIIIDFESFFKDAANRGITISEDIIIRAKEFREQESGFSRQCYGVSKEKKQNDAEYRRIAVQQKLALEKEACFAREEEERQNRAKVKRINRVILGIVLVAVAVAAVVLNRRINKLSSVDCFENYTAEFSGFSPRISLCNTKNTSPDGEQIFAMAIKGEQNGYLKEGSTITLFTKPQIGELQYKDFVVHGEGKYVDDIEEISAEEWQSLLDTAQDKVSDFAYMNNRFKSSYGDAEYIDFYVEYVDYCFATAKDSKAEDYNKLFMLYRIKENGFYYHHTIGKAPVDVDIYVLVEIDNLALNHSKKLIMEDDHYNILYDKFTFKANYEGWTSLGKTFNCVGYSNIKAIYGDIFVPLKEQYTLHNVFGND